VGIELERVFYLLQAASPAVEDNSSEFMEGNTLVERMFKPWRFLEDALCPRSFQIRERPHMCTGAISYQSDMFNYMAHIEKNKSIDSVSSSWL
jgi:hypothetical protein